MVGWLCGVFFLIHYWQMYFYINSTLALFGYHYENDLFGAINILLDTPGGDGNAIKMWYSGTPQVKQGTPYYEHHIRNADKLAKGKYK